jgi:hypothetical protein
MIQLPWLRDGEQSAQRRFGGGSRLQPQQREQQQTTPSAKAARHGFLFQ